MTNPRPRASSATSPALPAHARTLRTHRIARGVALGLTGVLLFGSTSVAGTVLTALGKVESVDSDKVLAAAGIQRPKVVEPTDPDAGIPLNILLMGSDDRSGVNAALGGDESGMRSDTTMVMHISGDRSRVDVVSIPRDSYVNIPECPTTNGKRVRPQHDKFNAAFAYAVAKGGDVESGALCAQTTVESLTGVRLDGFVVVDFEGFLNMIDALGGVEMCIPQDVHDEKAGNLTLSAGRQTLDGPTALQYARVRYTLGDGTDIGRIGRQQEMMASIARSVLGKNIFSDAPQLVSFLNAVTASLTMSSKFSSLTELPGLAYSLRGIDPRNTTFRTVPWRYPTAAEKAALKSRGSVVLWTDEADLLWENMAHDRPLDTPQGAEPTPAAPAAPAAPTTSAAPAAGTKPADKPTDKSADNAAAGETAPAPAPDEPKKAGYEDFTGADTTSVCGPAQ